MILSPQHKFKLQLASYYIPALCYSKTILDTQAMIHIQERLIGLLQKKSKRGGRVHGRIHAILFWKAPLEILDLSLYPKTFTAENSANLFDTPWKFQSQ